MDFSQMWSLSAWRRGPDNQHFWPNDWAAYCVLTLHKIGALDESPGKIDPDGSASRGEVRRQSAIAAHRTTRKQPFMPSNSADDNAPITRGEVCRLINDPRQRLPAVGQSV